jgi:hypothetical protein
VFVPVSFGHFEQNCKNFFFWLKIDFHRHRFCRIKVSPVRTRDSISRLNALWSKTICPTDLWGLWPKL